MNANNSPDLSLLATAIESFIPMGRSGLLPALHSAQKLYGWLPDYVSSYIAQSLKIPLSDVFGVIEFYDMFSTEPQGGKNFQVCTGQPCVLKGANSIQSQLIASMNSSRNTANEDTVTVKNSHCLGLCEHAPAILLNNRFVSNFYTAEGIFDFSIPPSKVYGTVRRLTKNCGLGKPIFLKEYGEYRAFQRALAMTQKEVISFIHEAGLVGRGGAAFPTAVKWQSALNAPSSEKYVICNADESEPGTFKDRVLLSNDPHLMIEGMRIAAYAIGASHGYIYLRGEYAYLFSILETAIHEAKVAGYINQTFDLEIRVGAGAYICGEETALFESMEGKRGFPRIKPPFPTTQGLFNSPTVINNVETLCNVPFILQEGPEKFRELGTEKSPGTKLFCVSGDVSRPGIYEVPFGVKLSEVLKMAKDNFSEIDILAILLGGAAGAFATNKQLDVKLSFEDLKENGLSLGSGVIMAFDKSRDLKEVLKFLAEFFAHESCGKCYPCQLGTQRQMEILDRISNGIFLPGDKERLQDIGLAMTDASLCGLGQTASTAILSAIKGFPDLLAEKQNSSD